MPRTALAIEPRLGRAWRTLGNALRDLGRMPEAVKALARAAEIDPDDAETRLDQALATLQAGDLETGFRAIRMALEDRRNGSNPPATAVWDGTGRPGRLVVRGEQGFGDIIQFSRFIALAARHADTVIVDVREPVRSLLQAMDLGDNVSVHQETRAATGDAEIGLMSLPHRLGTTWATLPRPPAIRLDPDRLARWAGMFADRPRIGLVWQGNPKARADRGRSPPLADLLPLIADRRYAVIALQKETGLDQIARLPEAARSTCRA